MESVILFRGSLAEEGELEVAENYFPVIAQRSQIQPNQLVIGRYSVLPYYRELEADVANLGGQLINSHQQYSYISKIDHWYPDFDDITPKTWFALEDIPEDGQFVLKGNINSRKQLWNTHMFADGKREAVEVYLKLMEDTMLSHQGVAIRRFEPLVGYGNDLVGIPISKEFRIFVYKNQIVSKGYYWSIHYDDICERGYDISAEQIPQDFLDDIVSRVGSQCNFWTVDVAQKTNGEWIVIEMGDAQMAGLSCNDPHILYNNIKDVENKNI